MKLPWHMGESPSTFQRRAVAHLPYFLHLGFCRDGKVGHKPRFAACYRQLPIRLQLAASLLEQTQL